METRILVYVLVATLMQDLGNRNNSKAIHPHVQQKSGICHTEGRPAVDFVENILNFLVRANDLCRCSSAANGRSYRLFQPPSRKLLVLSLMPKGLCKGLLTLNVGTHQTYLCPW